jgi:hypothetical protein
MFPFINFKFSPTTRTIFEITKRECFREPQRIENLTNMKPTPGLQKKDVTKLDVRPSILAILSKFS